MISEDLLLRAVLEVDRAILDMLPDPSECVHVFSKAFERKMKRLIYKTNHIVAYKLLNRAAIIFISLLASASMLLAFNPGARAAVMDWVREKFEGVYHYFFVSDNTTEEPRNYYMDWVPEGYTQVGVIEDPTGETHIYFNDSGETLQFTYVYGAEANTLMTGLGEYDEKHIEEGILQADIFIAKDVVQTNIITWTTNNDGVIFTICGFSDEQELIKMAQNVMPKN